MLTDTEEGQKGLKALFEFYEAYFGSESQALAEKCGYRICPEQIPLYNGQLVYEEKRIIVSREGPEILREFTIFHELGHHAPHDVAPFFAQELWEYNLADDMEYWCDHFALAMFFAKRGARLMDGRNYFSFLTQGNIAAYDGRDAKSPWRQSSVLARRIPKLARQFFRSKDIAYKECVVLQYSLLLSSKMIVLREAE